MIQEYEEPVTPQMKRRSFLKAAALFTTSALASLAMYVGFNWHVDRILSVDGQIPSPPDHLEAVMDLDTTHAVMKSWLDAGNRRFTFGAITSNDGLPLEQTEKLDAFYEEVSGDTDYTLASASLKHLSLSKKAPLFGGLLHAERILGRNETNVVVEKTQVLYGSTEIMADARTLSVLEAEKVAAFQASIVFGAANIFNAANDIAIEEGEKLESQALLESAQDMRKHFGSALEAKVLIIKDPAGVVCDDGIYYLHANDQVAELSFEEDGGVTQTSRLADGGLYSVTAFEGGEVVVVHNKKMPDGSVSVLSHFLGQAEGGWNVSCWLEKQGEPKTVKGVTLMTEPHDACAVFTIDEMVSMGNKVRSNSKMAFTGGPTKPSYLDLGMGTLSKADQMKHFKFG